MNGDRWWHNAACEGMPFELFDPPGSGRLSPSHLGLAMCRECPVRKECLADAIATRDTTGIRGGLTGNQRADILRGRTTRKPALYA